MVSRNRVFPMEEEEKADKQNGLQEAHTISNKLANGLPPQLSDAEFRQLTGANSLVSQEQKQSEDENRVRPLSSSQCGLKRRNSSLVNFEKMLQEMNATSSEACPRKRNEGEGAYTAILEFVDEVNEENDGENRERSQSDHGEDRSENQAGENESDGLKKTEDPNHTLLQYFGKLSSSADVDDPLDLDHIQSLLHEGASVNTSDRFGQTLLHEVSRTWGVDVAQFFIDQGADINKADDYGRTPLHVASSSDYPEMVRFLIENGADFHVRTKGELQTPLHFAVRNEASQCVRILLAYGATLEVRDYKQRTPLQLAAETNSAECARILTEAGASAGTRDDSGMSALTLMVTKMPSVALRALDQFHITDRTHRKQRYYLNFLEYCDPPDTKNHSVLTSPLQAVVEMNCFELIMHPIFQRLIEVKWGFFGMRAWLGIFLNVLLTVAYTVLGITHPIDVSNYYYPFNKNGWRIPLETLVVILTFNEIRKEAKEIYQSRRENKKFISWRKKEIKRDLEYCHPRWSQEETYIMQHVRQVKEHERFYFQDRWNYFDWVTYVMLIMVIILHIVNVVVENNKYNDIFIRILACSIILVWVRLLKFARPFPSQGPFVVILDNVLGDTIRWGFVIGMFYIPYAVAFWMLFGGRSDHPVKGYDTVYRLVYTIFQYPLVDNYGFDRLDKVAPIMARVLCGSFLIIAAIILMNLYIALLSNTFQRVYDNARATAAMQRARLLQDLESEASDKTVRRYREHIRGRCSPEGSDFLVIISDEEEKNRKQEEKIALVHTIVSDRLGGKKFGKVQKSEFDTILEDIDLLKRSQNKMEKSLERLQLRLEEIANLNTTIYQEITKLMQQGIEQKSAITGVNEKVTNLETNTVNKFGSLASGLDVKFETLETEEKLRNSALESNINTRFDKLETEFKNVSTCYDKHEQEITTRIEHLEAYVVSVEEDKMKEKKQRRSSLRPKSKSISSGGFQIVAANREVAKEAVIWTKKAVGDGRTQPLPEFDQSEEESTEKQERKTITLSGQAARDEYIARLKEKIEEENREVAKAAVISTKKAVGDGRTQPLPEFDQSEEESTEKQERKTITLSSQAARDEYIARLKEKIEETNREVAKAAVISTSKTVDDGRTQPLPEFDQNEEDSTEKQERKTITLSGQAAREEYTEFGQSEEDSTEKQERKTITLSGQAARDEYTARLNEKIGELSREAAAISTSETFDDGRTQLPEFEQSEEDSTEKQQRKATILSGQAAGDEYIARLNKKIGETNREVAKAAAISTSKAVDDGRTQLPEFGQSEEDSTAKKRRRTINLSGKAAREEYIARLNESLITTEGESDTEKEKITEKMQVRNSDSHKKNKQSSGET